MVFQFEHMDLDKDSRGPIGLNWRRWSLLELKDVMTRGKRTWKAKAGTA